MANPRVFIDPEQEVQCPYDESHMIQAKRFPYHLMKCRRNHVPAIYNYAVCPFTARHVIPRPEYNHHIATCVDRDIATCVVRHILEGDISFAAWLRNDPEALKGITNAPPYIEWNCPEPIEDWDAETAVLRIGADEQILNDLSKNRNTTGTKPSEKGEKKTEEVEEYKRRLVQIERRNEGMKVSHTNIFSWIY